MGFSSKNDDKPLKIFRVNGWDYIEMVRVYSEAEKIARKNHTPVLIHVDELTQPLGHSSSGRIKDISLRRGLIGRKSLIVI